MNGSQTDPIENELLYVQLVRAAQTSRFGMGLILVGWVHLLIFLGCHYLFIKGDRAAAHFLPLWGLDLALGFLILRGRLPIVKTAGIPGIRQIAVRVWLTFAILCFTSASLNSITGFQIDWFKISWSLLGTFAFATMAWIFHIALLIPAVQMSLTALLIAANPDQAYWIFGVSWLLTLETLGLILERPRWSERWISLRSRQLDPK